MSRSLPSGMIILWVICAIISILAPQSAAAAAASLIGIAAVVGFGLSHGSIRYGIGSSLIFFVIALLVSNALENLSILTGFPFGVYAHTPLMGPKLFLVPLIVGPSYYGFCYIAWSIAYSFLGGPVAVYDRQWMIAMPLVSAFVVVGADLCADPIAATLRGLWIYPHGGAFFGVPLSNYLGWFLTTWVVFQTFVVYLTAAKTTLQPVNRAYCYQPAAFWALMSLQYPLILLTSRIGGVVHDPSGWPWRSGDILQAAVLTSIYTMLGVAVTSALVVARRHPQKENLRG